MTARLIANHHAATLSDLDKRIIHAVPPGGNWRDIPEDIPSKRIAQIRHAARNGGGSRSTYYGRLHPARPAYTISTYYHRPGNGCTIHPSADRILTDREAARLQTFPDEVVFRGPARARQAQIGNAVPPLLATQVTAGIRPGTMVDLFSGAGGLSLGATMVGHELVAAVDVDRHSLSTLAGAHKNDVLTMAEDLSDPAARQRVLAAVDERLAERELNLLVGGPPCQGFSTAGACDPTDPRNRLLFEFVRCVEHWGPAHILFENVTGLWFRGRTVLNEALDRLRVLGYTLDCQVLHAEAFGVPQRRRRLVVQGILDGDPVWPAPWRQTAEPSYRRFQAEHAGADAPAPFTVHDAIGDLPAATSETPEGLVPLTARSASILGSWLRGDTDLATLVRLPGPTMASGDLALFAA